MYLFGSYAKIFWMIKCFEEDLNEWIDFVCRCRDGGNDYLQYDLIKGKVANDKVFRVVDIYYSSKLSDKIYVGKEGIQYLDYKVLVQILVETEKELFDGENL